MPGGGDGVRFAAFNPYHCSGDVFAEFLENDLNRLAQGERKIETLLSQRPKARQELQAWETGVRIYRAVRAHEAKQPAEFRRHYTETMKLYRDANEPAPTFGVAAVQGPLVLP